MGNLEGSYKGDNSNDERQIKPIYNSIDFVPNTLRLSISRSNMQGIYLYGADNNYPTKITQIAERASSLVKAKNTQSLFVAGLGFDGATAADVKNRTSIQLNSLGLTPYKLLKFCSDQKSNINIAIHVNYNQLGEAVEFTPIQYEFCRKKIFFKDDIFEKYVITNIWHLENDWTNGNFSRVTSLKKWIFDKKIAIDFSALECYAYNPDPFVVREQIAMSGGIENYPGQIFYMKRTEDIYQKALYDSVIDDAQLEAEIKLFGLSCIQNGYSIGGIFKHFDNVNNQKELEQFKAKLANTKGSINAGRILTVSVPSNADGNMPTNMFEATQLQNIDKLFEKQKEEAKQNIKEIYSIPNALIGRDTEGNFATQKMQETFDFYNSVTEPLRQELEIELTELFSNSIFENQIKLPIEIEPLQYISRIKTTEKTETNEKIN